MIYFIYEKVCNSNRLHFFCAAWIRFVYFFTDRVGCPFYAMTGFLCPGCGGTRAFYALMRADFLSALYYNPVIVLSIPFVLYLGIRFYAGKCKFQKGIVIPFICFLAFAVIYSIIRNVMAIPFLYTR